MKKQPIRIAQIMGKMDGGGVESVVMNYYRHIDRTKIQFDFIVDEDSTLIPVAEIEKLGGKIIIIPPYRKLRAYTKALTTIFRENKYRIAHSHINTLSVFPLRAARKAGVPVRIAHSHSTAGKGEFKRNLIKYALRPFAKVYATDYFACSGYAGKWLFGKKITKNPKFFVMHNAIDLEKFRFNLETREKKRKELGITPDQFVIGHVGRFMKQKNHTFLIDVFAEVVKKRPESILLLVGDGPLRAKIEQKVTSLNLSDKVLLLGQRSDTNELYCAMDVFVLPSLYEGLPVVAIEAQSNSLTAILSDNITIETQISGKVVFLPNNKNLWEEFLLGTHANRIIEPFPNSLPVSGVVKNLITKYEQIHG